MKRVKIIKRTVHYNGEYYTEGGDAVINMDDDAADVYEAHGVIEVLPEKVTEPVTASLPVPPPQVDASLLDYGFSEKEVELLEKNGVETIEALSQLDFDALVDMEGIGKATAQSILDTLGE